MGPNQFGYADFISELNYIYKIADAPNKETINKLRYFFDRHYAPNSPMAYRMIVDGIKAASNKVKGQKDKKLLRDFFYLFDRMY